jgi:hypothetical protein
VILNGLPLTKIHLRPVPQQRHVGGIKKTLTQNESMVYLSTL